MKIQIKSDTHNEFYYNQTRLASAEVLNMAYIHPEAYVIVLAGDIATPSCYKSIVEQYGSCGKPVIYVAGNHDNWGSTIESAREERKILFKDTNIIELDASVTVLEDIAFIGATLWTNLASPFDQINAARTKDFSIIKEMNVHKWDSLHVSHRQFIKLACDSPSPIGKKKVVVTHYLPTLKSTPPRFQGNPINCIFSSDCEDIMHMKNAPDIWIHGHTHDSWDYQLGNTRIICNPYGYNGYETNPNFKKDLLIEI